MISTYQNTEEALALYQGIVLAMSKNLRNQMPFRGLGFSA